MSVEIYCFHIPTGSNVLKAFFGISITIDGKNYIIWGDSNSNVGDFRVMAKVMESVKEVVISGELDEWVFGNWYKMENGMRFMRGWG